MYMHIQTLLYILMTTYLTTYISCNVFSYFPVEVQ